MEKKIKKKKLVLLILCASKYNLTRVLSNGSQEFFAAVISADCRFSLSADNV